MEFNGINFDTYLKRYPDQNGYFGKYGGAYVSPELKKAKEEITERATASLRLRAGSLSFISFIIFFIIIYVPF